MNQVSPMRTVAVILAGGIGERMGLGMPKQLLKIAGRPIIEHTVRLFQDAKEIDEIIVMMAPDFLNEAKAVTKRYPKVTRVIAGGATRSDTTRRALEAIPDKECKVLFHDAVRPLVSESIVTQCIVTLDTYRAVDVAIPSVDTVIEVENDIIRSIPDRSRLMRGQTPQGFLLSTIRRAYELAAGDSDFQATDDCGVVAKYLPDVPIAVVRGTERNMKVTHPIDAYIVDKLFQLSTATYDTGDTSQLAGKLKGKTVVILGGSYGIGAAIGRLAEECGAKVFAFSRSATGTHVQNGADVEKALAEAFEASGRIDYVVNTAGILKIGELEEQSTEAIKELIDVNYMAPVLIARAALPYLRQTKGQLLLFTSSSYTRGRAEYSVYSSTKAAVVNLTQALSEEWAADGVRVNCINPERTATPMRTKAFGEEAPGTLLDAETVAKTSLDVLARDITGQVFDVRRKS